MFWFNVVVIVVIIITVIAYIGWVLSENIYLCLVVAYGYLPGIARHYYYRQWAKALNRQISKENCEKKEKEKKRKKRKTKAICQQL